jgi:hypothetical protein
MWYRLPLSLVLIAAEAVSKEVSGYELAIGTIMETILRIFWNWRPCEKCE